MDNDNKLKKSYYAIVPADVRYHPGFKGGDPRLLYGEITALCNDRGYCWASNQYFAELYQVDARTIRRWVHDLEKLGFIFVEIKGKTRHIFLAQKFTAFNPDGLIEEQDEPAPKNKKKAAAKKAPAKKEVVVKASEEDKLIAEMLLSKIILNFPTFENKKVSLAEWADDIRKLREIDKAKEDEIRFMITWVQGGEWTLRDGRVRMFEPHDFWSTNIMSARKLRKQWFEHLVPQLQTAFKKDVKRAEKQTVGKA